MHFASDNASPAHPRILQALAEANAGRTLSYGQDPWTARATARIREIFEAPEAEVFYVATGTAANALSLAALARPWDVIFCSDLAHVYVDECNGPEFFTGGAKLHKVPTPDGRIRPDALAREIAITPPPRQIDMQRGPVTLTNLTEAGTLYSAAEVAAIAEVARANNLAVHMDGARFANALVASNASPAEMTWQAGVDILSFGGTKNGLLGVEAIVIFSPERADHFALRHRRGAHLFSKQRYLAAQILAYLTDDLWRIMARAANAAGQRLVEGLRDTAGAKLVYQPAANMVFASLPRHAHQRLAAAGAEYYFNHALLDSGPADEPLQARLVTSWDTKDGEIDTFLALSRG
ncbi:MAG: low specificity L-threonine aldolase [Alphaproteobacteria bacterium]|nr:low specificity L-threonine aldolase [Alphaproteobacteria bacterium]NNF24105.1 low specificity L-threonine aldolase [Paracoccaceae bacterium]